MTDGGGQLTRNADNSRQIRRRINLALKLRAVECLVWVAPKTARNPAHHQVKKNAAQRFLNRSTQRGIGNHRRRSYRRVGVPAKTTWRNLLVHKSCITGLILTIAGTSKQSEWTIGRGTLLIFIL
jgi:hypothetical protein